MQPLTYHFLSETCDDSRHPHFTLLRRGSWREEGVPAGRDSLFGTSQTTAWAVFLLRWAPKYERDIMLETLLLSLGVVETKDVGLTSSDQDQPSFIGLKLRL